MTDLPANSKNSAISLSRRGKGVATRFSNRERDALSRSVYLEETGPGWGARGTIAAVCALILIFIIWSALTAFDEVVAARGEILPTSFVQPVQHLEGGIVASVNVSEGDVVEAGDPIATMSKAAPSSDYMSLKVREASLAMQMERLRTFALGGVPDFTAFENKYPQLVAEQKRIFETQSDARDAQLSAIASQINAREQEVIGLEEHHATLKKQILLLQEELDLRQILLDKGLTNKVIYLDTKRRLNEVEGETARTTAEIARARAQVAEARSNRLQVEERLRGDALELLGQFSNEHAEMNERLSELEDRLDRTTVRAPVAGTVTGLTISGPGAVIQPGTLIAEIVPDDHTILAEGRISPRDIGHIEVGQQVRVKVDTYDYTRFGTVNGAVQSISATSLRDEEGNPYFRSLISLEQTHVGDDPRNNRITPGMTVVADIKTGEKSLLSYLWRPVHQTLSGAFSER